MVKTYLAERLIISVGEAKKLLCSEADNMSDDDIADLILKLNELAPRLLEIAFHKKDIL